MAKQDAAETAKEFLRQVIKYRFWISISVAALFAVIAYFVGSGPVREKADGERSKITKAEKDVQQYQVPTIPTKEYMPIVQGKTQVLDKDVNAAWRTLFDRQAPLLTWPERVQERFRTWGRKWPEKADPSKVQLAIVDYIYAYPAYVEMVYKSCNPFDYETGSGVVVTSGQDALLRPAKFEPEHVPDLGKVWASQERLWIQRTLLEVVAAVNKNAKTWDDAIIRQIVTLEVGNSTAQDQRSIVKNEQLVEAEGIYAPGEKPAETTDGSAPAGAGSAASKGITMGNMGGGLGSAADQSVYYVKADSDKYKVLPLLMSVLIDQDHVQDFLVELENSPMWIQVRDFELVRPTARVTKPEKGEEVAGGMMGMMGMRQGGGMGMGGMGMGGMPGMGGMSGMGGMMQMRLQQQMGMAAQMQGSMSSMANMGGGMGGGGAVEEKKGKSMKGVDSAKKRQEQAKAAAEAKGPMYSDPYFNIVEVRVYGQARFFNPPPEAPAGEPSPGEVAAAPASKEAEKAAPGEASTPAATDAAEKPAPAPDAVPKKADAAPKAGTAPAAPKPPTAPPDEPAAPAAGTDEPDAKPSKNDAPAKTQPQDAKTKP